MDLVLYAVWCFAVAFAGGLVGLVLGNLRLPATLLVAVSPGAGAGANLIASAAAAGTASVAHVRAGRVNWRLFAWMAPPSVVFALLGGWLGGAMPRDLLLGAISVVLAVSALQLLGWQPVPRHEHAGLDVRAAVASGAVVGFLGGVVGLILGSLRMPALLRLVGRRPRARPGRTSPSGSSSGSRARSGTCRPPPRTGGSPRSAPARRCPARFWARA